MPELEEQVFFHLTGARSNGSLAPALGMRPALFARFGGLTKLRYDFPVVLVAKGDDAVVTLSGVIDDLLAEVAPKGIAGERMRRNLLRIEREIRGLKARGDSGTRAPHASASHSQATSISSVHVNCRTWPPPQNSSS